MKKIFLRFLFILTFVSLSSCSIQQMAYNAIAPLPEKKLKNENKPKKKNAGDPILAFTSETDIKLVADAFPVLLKTVEMLYFNDPSHRGVSIMAGQLFIMYANAFVERPAKQMSDDFYNEKHAEFMRAKKFYLRGAKYVFNALNLEYPGFSENVFSLDETKVSSAINQLKPHNVEAIFYGASGLLAAFALEPLDAEVMDRVDAARLMLEKACELNPSFNGGSLWEVLTSYYVAVPEGFGGGEEKAKAAYKKAMEYSQGKTPSIYITYATAFCVPVQDGDAFVANLKKALAINPDDNPETRLMTILSQDTARWMLEHKDEFIY